MDIFLCILVGITLIVCTCFFIWMVHLTMWLMFEDKYEDFIKKVRASMVRRRIFREMHYDSTFAYVVKKNGMLGCPFFWRNEKSFKDEDSARNYVVTKKAEYERKYGKKVVKSTRIK